MPPVRAYVSRPNILIAGQFQGALTANVVALAVEESVDGLANCEVRVSNYGPRSRNAGYLYFGRDVVDFGNDLAVEVGPRDDSRKIFAGRVTALEAEYPMGGGAELVVLAEDRLQELRMKRRTRTFEDVTDEDVLRQIAQEHSLTPDLSLDGPSYRTLAQVNQSDLAFIRDRVRSIGAELWIDGTTLSARPRTDRNGDAIALQYGVNLLAFTARADLAHQVTEIGVSGWDVAAKDAIDEVGDESAIASELNGGDSGSRVLAAALAERKERIVHGVPLTVAQARSMVEASYRSRARRFVTGSGLADGDARLRAGVTVTLSGLGSLFDGDYYVVRVRHTYNLADGYRTEFDVERPGLGPAER